MNSETSDSHRPVESSTNWTRDIEPARERGEALERLVVASLVRLTQRADYKWRWAIGNHADDLIQAFVVKMLEGNVVSKADRQKGRFRTFLLRCFDHHVIDWLRRKTPPEDVVELDSCAADSHPFDVIWAEEIFRLACEQLELRCRVNDALDIWNVANDQIVGPVMRASAPLTYEQLAERHQLASPNAAGGKVRTARKWFLQCTRALIERFATSDDDVDLELRSLIDALSGRGHFDRPGEPGVAYLHSHLATDLEEYDSEMWRNIEPLARSSEPPIVCFDDLFHHPDPPRELLAHVKSFAKATIADEGQDMPEEVAQVLYYASIAVARQKCKEGVSDLTDEDFKAGLGWCLRRRWLDDGLRGLFEDAKSQFRQ